MKHNGNGPVVAIDVDGTLGDYHSHFLHFAEAWYGRRMPDAQEINPGLPLHKFMHTSKSTYRRCKLAYRQGGLKRSMPAYPGASELCKTLRKVGAELWICTTRPYLRLDNIDPDTREWLRRNKIQYDAVIYGEHKYRDLIKCVGRERVACILDDLPQLVIQATSLGVHGMIRDQPYNKHFSWHLRVMDMEDALEGIMYRLKEWRDKNG
jgi:5' nucleotidase, deoxy (Pyrimidine), cytosolic type C protein (NT5C)